MHIAIIGAGASGLKAAQTFLQKQSHSNKEFVLTILEASDYIGGRIKSDYSFLLNHNNKTQRECSNHSDVITNKYGIELGAEFIHGGGSILDQMVKEEGWDTEHIFISSQADGGPDESPTPDQGKYGAYWLGNEHIMLPYDSKDEDFVALNEALHSMLDCDDDEEDDVRLKQNNNYFPKNTSPDLSLGDLLKQKQIPERMIGLAQAGYANTAGCSNLNHISLAASTAYERYWAHNEQSLDVRIKDPAVTMKGVIDILVKEITNHDNLTMKLNWKVSSINYSNQNIHNNRCEITSTSGQIIHADYCIISVPITILKENDIEFIPPLPQSKLDSFQMYGMERVCKLLLKFKKRLWPSKLQSVVCADSFIPEMWFREYNVVDNQIQNDQEKLSNNSSAYNTFIAVCYCTSDAANVVSNYGLEKSTQIALDQIQQMFDLCKSDIDSAYISSLLHDWGKHPTIRGGYSFPKVGILPHHFEAVAANVNNTLFFCGEHTHCAPMTVQAALETGERAAEEVILVVNGE